MAAEYSPHETRGGMDGMVKLTGAVPSASTLASPTSSCGWRTWLVGTSAVPVSEWEKVLERSKEEDEDNDIDDDGNLWVQHGSRSTINVEYFAVGDVETVLTALAIGSHLREGVEDVGV